MDPRVLPWAPALDLPGTGTGRVFLFGGFGAGPEPLRPLAARLQREGWTVRVAALGRHTGDAAVFHRSRTWHYYLEGAKAFRRFAESGEGPIVLGGYSTGALVALLLAARTPAQVAGLVLVSPVLRTARTGTQLVGYSYGSLYYFGLPVAMLATTLAIVARGRRTGWNRAGVGLRAFATASVFAAAALGMRRITVPLRSGGTMEVDGELVMPPHFERVSLVTGSTLVPLQLAARRRLASLTVPTCVVFGSDDDVVDVAYGVLRAGRVPGAEVHVVDGAPHRVIALPACHDVVAGFTQRVLSAGAQDSAGSRG